MNKRLLEAFEDDFTSFSDSYFTTTATMEKMKRYNTNTWELIELQREFFSSFWFDRASDVISNKEKPYDTFPLDYCCAICGVYWPDEKYLTKIVEFLERLLEEGNEQYLKNVICYDPADIYDVSGSHSNILSYLVADTKYLFTWYPNHGPRTIVGVDRRFTGLLPFLFDNKYFDLYNRVFNFCLTIFKKFKSKTGLLVFSILNFLKQSDKSSYEIFKKEFDAIYENDKTIWQENLMKRVYGNGFEVKQQYWEKPFINAIE